MAEPGGRGPGAVDAERVLGGVAAVGGAQPEGVRVVAEDAGHGGDAVHRVVVPRAAGEAHAAGDGELALEVEAELARPRSARRTGSTSRGRRGPSSSVLGAGQLERAAARRARMAGDECRSARLDTYQWSWAPVPAWGNTQRSRGDAQRAGRLDRAEDEPGALLDVVVRVHELRVREADHAVVRRGGGDLVGRVGPLDPRVRVRRPRPR